MSWTGRMFAKKVIRSSEASTSNENAEPDSCPECGHQLSKQEFYGFPAGVKFDPSDKQILEHLAAKSGISGSVHPYLDEFILTLEGEDGICYTHPENLPGVKSDGTSSHFFHRPACAYGKGTRKRRRICTDGGEMRWHKTGKTRPVVENDKRIGWKKIMVLYTNFTSSNRKTKPKKTNWVMHQYHCGEDEEERDGELVVSKVFYQTQPRVPSNKLQRLATAAIGAAANEESDDGDDDPDSTNGGFEETVPAPPRPLQFTPLRPCPTRDTTVVEVPQPSALNAGTPDSMHSAVNRHAEEGETLDIDQLFCDENLPDEQLSSQDIRDLATAVGLNLDDDEDLGKLDIQSLEEYSSQEMRDWFP